MSGARYVGPLSRLPSTTQLRGLKRETQSATLGMQVKNYRLYTEIKGARFSR